MKGFKCTVSMILVLTVFALMAMGSGSSGSSEDKAITSVGNGSTDDTVSTGESADDGEEATDSANDTENIIIEETVLLDEQDVKITATGLEDGWMGTELKLLIENNSAQNLTIQARNASVNGYMVDTMMSADVAAGKKANDELTFLTSALKECGIDTFAEIEFSFHIFTMEDWEDYLDSDLITVETSAAGTYVQEVNREGEVLYDAKGITIIGKGLSTDDSIFGPGLICYIENNTDGNITVQARDTSVNGYMIDTIMSQDVIKGKRAITAVTFFSSSLEESGIEDISEIELSFHIFDMDSWDTIEDTDSITINF